MTVQDDDRDFIPDGTTAGGMSRRHLLTAGLAAASAGLASVPTAGASDERSHRSIGIAREGSTAVEFRAHLNQTGPTGEHFIAFGYLTRVEGAPDSDLFAAQEQDETTALLTAFASGDLSRRIHDGSVHSIDIEGSLTIYQRPVPGASWDDPTSFQFGDKVATFKVTLQDVLTVFAPGRGLPTLNGDMEQTLADELGGRGRGRGPKFGHVGARARLLATGLGTLVDPVALNSRLEMAGNWSSK
jgi:hypothetical protein